MYMKETTLRNEKGFALLAEFIATLILLAVGMLVINMSAGDLISTTMSVGNKKASTHGNRIFNLMETFSPANSNSCFTCTGNDTAASLTSGSNAWQTNQ